MNKRVIRIQEVCQKIGISRTSLWRLNKQEDFPRPILLRSRTPAYFEHEIDAWLDAQGSQRVAMDQGI